MIDRDRKIRLLEAMEKNGSGFSSALATAWFKADSGNSAKLEAAFGDMLESYSAFLPAKRAAEKGLLP